MNVTHVSERQLTDFLVENQARFYRLAYSYLQDREEALDAVQAAVCRALERQESLREADAMRTWFYRILVNVCMDALRRRKLVTLVPPEVLDAGSYEDPLPADGDLARRVEAVTMDQVVAAARRLELDTVYFLKGREGKAHG